MTGTEVIALIEIAGTLTKAVLGLVEASEAVPPEKREAIKNDLEAKNKKIEQIVAEAKERLAAE